MSDNDRLAEIEARCAAATEGPWWWENWHDDYYPDGPAFTLVARPETGAAWRPDCNFPELANNLISDEDREISDPDKAFIANARTDIPWLIAQLREARASRERLRRFAESAYHVRSAKKYVDAWAGAESRLVWSKKMHAMLDAVAVDDMLPGDLEAEG